MRSPDNARQLERNGPALEAGARELAAETYAADLAMDGVPESGSGGRQKAGRVCNLIPEVFQAT
jgi:hypothetical protein